MKNLLILIISIVFLHNAAYSQSFSQANNYSFQENEKQTLSETVKSLIKKVESNKLKRNSAIKSSKILIAKFPSDFNSNMPTYNPDPNIHYHLQVTTH